MIYDTNLSRRQFLGASALLATSSLSACGKEDVIRYWASGTLDIGAQNWQALQKSLGIKVDFKDNGNDIGPILAQMITGTAATEYDVGGIQGGAEGELYRAGTIQPWDLSKIPNWDSVWVAAKSIKTLRLADKQIALPIVINADSMIYLEKETGIIDSYAAVFDPKFKGKTSMEDTWINSVIFTAMFMKANNIDGLSRISDPADLEVDELNTVIEFLKKKKREGQFLKFWRGWQEGVDLISNRDVYVMTGWEPIVKTAIARGATDARYAVPREGYEGWSNNLVLNVGATKRETVEAAHRFANWQLAGNYGCVLGALRGYMVPNDKCLQLSSAADVSYFDVDTGTEKKVTGSSARELSQHVRDKFESNRGSYYFQNTRPKNYQLYERLWTELRAI